MISMWQILIILLIVVLLFGTKKLRNMGGDIGAAVKGFKDGMKTPEETDNQEQLEQDKGQTFDGEATQVNEKNK